MAAAAATAAATLQVIPAAEDKVARIQSVVNVLDQRTVGAITARQCHCCFEWHRLQALAD